MMISATPSGNFLIPRTQLPAPPRESRDPEKFGTSRRQITVVCCRACLSVHVLRRTSRTGKPYAWWQCQEAGCEYMWKEPFLVGRGSRASVAD